MTDIPALARRRAQRLAHLESLAGWDNSPNDKERAVYAKVARDYRNAEEAYQRATATFTAEELAAMFPPIRKERAA